MKRSILILTFAAIGCGELDEGELDEGAPDEAAGDIEVKQSALSQTVRCDRIHTKYASAGMAQLLGAVVAQCDATHRNHGDGASELYQNGGIWFGDTVNAAFEVHGLIFNKYQALGAQASVLKYPKSDESNARFGGGKYNAFQFGNILWTVGATEAFEVHGGIASYWGYLGSEWGNLSWPTSDEFQISSPTRRKNDFVRGKMYWTSTKGPWPVMTTSNTSSFLATANWPRIGATLGGIPAGGNLSVSGEGFTPGARVSVNLTSPAGKTWGSVGVLVDSQGRFSFAQFVEKMFIKKINAIATIWAFQDDAHQAVRGVITGAGTEFTGTM